MPKQKADWELKFRELIKGYVGHDELVSFIETLLKEAVEKEKDKWWHACNYNCDMRTWNRIQGAYHALNKPKH